MAKLSFSLRKLLRAVRERLHRAQGAVGTRLTVGYVLLLAVSVALLYGLADWQLRRVLRARDRGVIAEEVSELARAYTEEGRAAVREEIDEQPTGPAKRALYIRLATPDGRTLLDSAPEPDVRAHLEKQEIPQEISSTLTWSRVPRGDDEEALDVATRRLPGGDILQAGASSEPRAEVFEQFRNTFAGAALVVLALGVAGGLALARRVLRPLRRLARVTERIAATGELAARVPLRGTGDELDTLAGLFNDMLARVERLVAGLRETLDHVAHDLRTPVTRLRGRAEIALQREAVSDEASSSETPTEKVYREALSDSLEAAAQVQSTLDAIMDEAEAQSGTLPLRLERISLKEVAEEVVDLYDYVAEEKGVALHLEEGPGVTVTADAGRLRQAAANLVDNAIKYTPAGGEVEVEIAPEEGGGVIRVRDTGPGIAEEDVPRIWDRLYRADRSRSTRGLGLGLSLARSFVEAHGGTVAARSTPGEGSVFSMWVPKNQP